MALLTMKDATVVFFDDDGTNTVTITAEDGTLSFTLPDTVQHAPDRGSLGRLMDGEFQPITFSMDLQVDDYTGTAQPGDVVTGNATGWDYGKYVTGGPAGFTELATGLQDDGGLGTIFNIRVTYTDPDTAAVERLYFTNCAASLSHSEGFPNKWNLSGTSYETVSNFWNNIATT